MERVFPVYSPLIEKLEVVRRGDVRRSKLYYIRSLSGKKARIKEKRFDNRTNVSNKVAEESPSIVEENKEDK